MKRLILLLVPTIMLSQVGINTTNPQGIFHIDGGKDNPITGIPTTTQQLNDFVVKNDGKVGISTLEPTKNLDINGEVRIRTLTLGDSTDYVVVADVNGNLKRIPMSALTGNNNGTCPSFMRSLSSGQYLLFTSPSSIQNPNDNIVIQGKTFVSAGTWISNNTYYFSYTGINGAININNSFTVNFGTLPCTYTN